MRQLKVNNIFLALLLHACAQQSVPTGGEKDSEAPKLQQSIPSNRQTNFKGNQITLIFNEFVQLNNPREQIIITPEVDIKKTEVTARKNKVILRFNQTLKDSTTYTINFREAVQDITEKNPASNLRLAFSTGPDIDTLSIKGKVLQLLTDEPESNCMVALAPASDTFDIFRHKPEYFTLSDKQGNYALENLKAGSYILYAFQDKNKNLIVDSKSEMFGFRGRPVTLKQENESIDLHIIKLDMRPLKLASARPLGNHFIIRMNKGLLDKKIISEDPSTRIFFDEPENGVIRIYNTFNNKDSIALKCHLSDSTNNSIDTVLYARFSGKNLQPEKFKMTNEEAAYLNMNITTNITFSKPVLRTDTDSIYIPVDSLTIIKLNPENFTFNNNQTTCKVTIQLPKPLNFEPKSKSQITARSRDDRLRNPGKSANPKMLYNHIIFAKGAFISAEGDSSDLLTVRINETKPEAKATLIYEVLTTNNAIAELYQKGKTIIKSNFTKGKFTNIDPGEYRLRALLDINNNGQWDWGNYYKRLEPEPVWHYQDNSNKNIPLKANWEVGPLLIKSKQNVEN